MPFTRDTVPEISVAEFVRKVPSELEVEFLTGESEADTRRISSERIQKLGLALAGYPKYIHPGRIQIIGASEASYLSQLPEGGIPAALNNLDPDRICCILATKLITPPPEVLRFAAENGIPALRTPLVSSKAISIVTNFLQEVLAPRVTVHGVLMSMYGVGVLLLGESGIGKSECALDLISRGHGLVSDDTVEVRKVGRRLIGSSPELTLGHLEIRGLGIVSIRDLFGVSAICFSTDVKLCIEFRRWEDVSDIERIGLDMNEHEIVGISVPKFVLPIRPGRNLSTLVETAVRTFLLREAGIDAASDLIARHTALLEEK